MRQRRPATRPPVHHEQWLARLRAANVHRQFDLTLAETLRVVAGMRQDAVCLCSGPGTLPYVGWVRDGLRMSSRLIIHLDPALRHLQDLLQLQLDDDIRVAGHFQDLEAFGRDIARHRIDFLLAEIDAANRSAMDGMISLLNDGALLVFVTEKSLQPELLRSYADDYFITAVGGASSAFMLCRKGRQHRLGRRRSKRRAADRER